MHVTLPQISNLHSHHIVPRVEDKVGDAEDDEGGVGKVTAAAAVDHKLPEAGGEGRPGECSTVPFQSPEFKFRFVFSPLQMFRFSGGQFN